MILFGLKPWEAARMVFGRSASHLILFIAAGSNCAWAQATNKGEISGTILDSSGSAVSGAEVRLAEINTGFTRRTVSNGHGMYGFLLLAPGDYAIEVLKDGFNTERKTGVAAETQAKVVLDFELQPGPISQTILVEAQGDPLRPTEVALTSVVPQWQLKELPLNDKLLADFTRLEAGVTPRQLTTSESGPNSDSGGFMNGLRQFFVHVTLDGGHFDDPTWPGGTITNTQGVSFDAVKEFTLIKGNADATQASGAGYTIDITTRNGTEQYHGDLFEYLRNNALDARNFFDQGGTLPLRRNQFGASASGPIPIRKNKDFFFANYEGFRRAFHRTVVPIVPTDRLLEKVPGGPSNGYLRELLLNTYPRPLPVGVAPNALVAPATSTVDLGMDREMSVIRLDDELSSKHRAMFRYSFINGSTAPGVSVGPGTAGGAVGFAWRFFNFLAGLNSVLSPRSTNEFRFTFNRPLHHFTAEPTPAALVGLGFDPTANEAHGLPFIFFAGTGLTSDGVLPFVPKQRHSNVFEWSDVFSTSRGNHFMSFGTTVSRTQSHWLMGENIRPSTVFIGFGPPFDTSTFGITTGRFLSQTQNFIIDPPTAIRGFRFTSLAAFFQDSYRVSSNVSLIYGLRYSFNTPLNEVNGLLSNAYPVDPGTDNPVEDGSITNATLGSLAVRTVRQFPFSRFNLTDFAPNAGVAWKPFRNAGTVLKAGYSVSYGNPFIELVRLTGFNPPFGVSTVIRAAQFGTVPDPNHLTVAPALNLYNPAASDPQVRYWNVTLEQKLDQDSVLRVSYIGNQGSHLWDTRQPNYGAGFTGQRPNPNYSVISLTETEARSNYNALRLEVNRRLHYGLAVQGTYVFSKTLDDISGAVSTLCPSGFGCLPTDQRNLRANYGLADFDVRHTATVNFIYEVPFRSGHAPLATMSRGWVLSGIVSYWDGLPFDVVSGIDNNGDGVANDRALVRPAADPHQVLRGNLTMLQYLDSASATTIFSQTFGVPLPRNFFRGPGLTNVDFQVRKSMVLGENRSLSLGFEFFNLLNHTNFANPINSLGSPAFGRVVATSTDPREIQVGLKFSF